MTLDQTCTGCRSPMDRITSRRGFDGDYCPQCWTQHALAHQAATAATRFAVETKESKLADKEYRIVFQYNRPRAPRLRLALASVMLRMVAAVLGRWKLRAAEGKAKAHATYRGIGYDPLECGRCGRHPNRLHKFRDESLCWDCFDEQLTMPEAPHPREQHEAGDLVACRSCGWGCPPHMRAVRDQRTMCLWCDLVAREGLIPPPGGEPEAPKPIPADKVNQYIDPEYVKRLEARESNEAAM